MISITNRISLLIKTSLNVNYTYRSWFTLPYEYLEKKIRELPDAYYKMKKVKEISILVLALTSFALWCIFKLVLRALIMRWYYCSISLTYLFTFHREKAEAVD